MNIESANSKNFGSLDTAMILAAGLGVRMRPLTTDRPKAMVALKRRPIIDYTFKALEKAQISRVIINVHHAPQPLIQHLEDHPFQGEIIISGEQDLLCDTGGGVKRALNLIERDYFFIANCDAFFPDTSRNPFKDLGSVWNRETMEALLLMIDRKKANGYQGLGDYFLEQDDALKKRSKTKEAPYVFGGAQIMSTRLFENETDTVFPITRAFDRAEGKHALFGLFYDGPWFHVGTPSDISGAEKLLNMKDGS